MAFADTELTPITSRETEEQVMELAANVAKLDDRAENSSGASADDSERKAAELWSTAMRKLRRDQLEGMVASDDPSRKRRALLMAAKGRDEQLIKDLVGLAVSRPISIGESLRAAIESASNMITKFVKERAESLDRSRRGTRSHDTYALKSTSSNLDQETLSRVVSQIQRLVESSATKLELLQNYSGLLCAQVAHGENYGTPELDDQGRVLLQKGVLNRLQVWFCPAGVQISPANASTFEAIDIRDGEAGDQDVPFRVHCFSDALEMKPNTAVIKAPRNAQSESAFFIFIVPSDADDFRIWVRAYQNTRIVQVVGLNCKVMG